MSNIVQLSRDPFARSTKVRRTVKTVCGCSWCGATRWRRGLFEYGTLYDGNHQQPNWHDGLFCSIDCHNAYHGV